MSDKLAVIQNSLMEIKPEFESNIKSLGLKNVTFNQEMSFALQRLQENTYLQGMPLDSIVKAVLNVSLTGITLNPVLKLAYLIPRKGKCVLDISYMGLCKILTDTGSVKNIEANIVYWGEPFKLTRGTNPVIEHGLIEEEGVKKGSIRGAYSVATLNDGSKTLEWMDADELMSIMQRSESVKKGKSSAWSSDTGEMCRKTVLKRHYKYLPKSERGLIAAQAVEIDHENNGIDFEEERKQQGQPKTVNIDVLNPNDKETRDKFEPMMQAISQPNVPDDAFGPGTNKEAFLSEFRNAFESGTMSVEYGDSVYNHVLNFFQQN